MSASQPRRPTIRRVRDWAPGATVPPPETETAKKMTLDESGDLPTRVARADLHQLEKMVKTESGIRDLFMPIVGEETIAPRSERTMEVLEAEIVTVKSDIRELSPTRSAESLRDLESLVNVYERRADQAFVSPSTQEIDGDAIEEVRKNASVPPPLPRKQPVKQQRPPQRPPVKAIVAIYAAIIVAHVRSYRMRLSPHVGKIGKVAKIENLAPFGKKVMQFAARWPELYDLDRGTKVIVIALWLALWVNLTLWIAR